ncbi:ECF transporter S component [Arthrobacter sp.]|jgi:energy-coupling factor transport system substrate-specific component|uniref:ECF transporter S component n=1 Tax=Arthrobacter sp. TaxID=1667 RepID=UPI002589DDFC|nr:ECF transporter S component [Arthrobacter sp.]
MSKSVAGNSANPRTAPKSTWRVVDIVVASVLSVAVGVIFWLWSAGYGFIAALTVAFPPIGGLYGGGWLIAGVIGALVIRKPGAALYCELVAAIVEALLGSSFGFTVLLSGLVQGLGAEIIFAVFRYRRFTLPVALLAGALSGVAMGINDSLVYNVEWAFVWKLVYTLFGAISGAVIAGLLSWLAVRGLARTGALGNLPSRGAAAEPVV